MWPFKSSVQLVAGYKSAHLPQDDDDFVRGRSLPTHPRSSAIALGVRAAIAELGKIDVAYIRASDRFDRDLVCLPFWGSLDTIGVVLALERNLGVTICDDEAQCVRNPEVTPGVTVAEFVADVYKVIGGKLAMQEG